MLQLFKLAHKFYVAGASRRGGTITNLALLIRAAIKDNVTCKMYCCTYKYMTKIADLNGTFCGGIGLTGGRYIAGHEFTLKAKINTTFFHLLTVLLIIYS